MRIPHYLIKPYQLACQSDGSVLLLGPAGVGKSMLARSIHKNGPRAEKPFVAVDVTSLGEKAFESKLFGLMCDALAICDQSSLGRVGLAKGGTLFLDEIGELSPKMQARLLEALRSLMRFSVEGKSSVPQDIKIITSSCRNLEQMTLKGGFLKDLFHHISSVALQLRPIEKEPEEFDLLVHECLEEICRKVGRSISGISEEMAQALESYQWPGNIRELRNVLEFAVLASKESVLSARDLPEWFVTALFSRTSQSGTSALKQRDQPVLGVAEIELTLNYHDVIARFEKEYLTRALKRYQGHINATAKGLGINKQTLIHRMRAYALLSKADHKSLSG